MLVEDFTSGVSPILFGIVGPKKHPPVVEVETDMGVSENSGFSPQIIHFNRVFHYKPSILGYHYFRKHPYGIVDSFN